MHPCRTCSILCASSSSQCSRRTVCVQYRACSGQCCKACAPGQCCRAPGKGGKAACAEQRRLRQVCFETSTYEVDLSVGEYDWRGLIRSMPHEQACGLVGDGIVAAKFRLLQNVMDSNYIKIDSGETHVFEFECQSGGRTQLHYHASGKADSPTIFEATATSAAKPVSLDSAAKPIELEPAWTWEKCMEAGSSAAQPVRQNEVSMAFCVLARHYIGETGPWPAAIDITSELVFPWSRWLRNITKNREIVRGGISKVCIKLSGPTTAGVAVFCRADDTYVEVGMCSQQHLLEGQQWRADPLCMSAAVAAISWLRIRQGGVSL